MKKINKNLLTLFLVVFIDMIGVGIVLPVLTPLFLGDASIVPANWTADTRTIVLGLLIASYPMMQFFGAPILGTLSDRFGRKPVLAFSLTGTLIGYLIFAYALLIGNIPLLFASRALDGFTGGNVAVAMSSIADMTKEKDRAKNFGLVGAAFGLGFIFGPFIGGTLADPQVVSWFNPSLPFLFASALTFINIIMLLSIFKESIPKKIYKPIRLFMGFINIHKALQIRELAMLFLVNFTFFFGFTFFTQFFPVVLVNRFDFGSAEIGQVFGVVGISLAFTQGVMTRVVSKYAGPAKVMHYGLPLFSLTLFLTIFPYDIFWLYVTQVLVSFPAALCIPNSTALVSQLCPEDKQGEILGINQSFNSLGHAIPPIIAGFIVSMGDTVPTIASAIFVFLAWVIYQVFLRQHPSVLK